MAIEAAKRLLGDAALLVCDGRAFGSAYSGPTMSGIFGRCVSVAAAVAALPEAAPEALEAPVGDGVRWERLEAWQGSVERGAFFEALEELYAPEGRWQPWILNEPAGARLLAAARGSEGYLLRFASGAEGDVRETDPEENRPAAVGLRGLRIALDPGHIGGEWAEIEGRSFSIGEGGVVREGDLTLATALRLRDMLEARGAVVWLTRSAAEPTTSLRPADFMEEAAERLAERHDLEAQERAEAIQALAERLFYRSAEIRERARRLNTEFQPDLAIALHINAGKWSDPQRPTLLSDNNGHVIVHGCYLAEELEDPESRLLMLERLLKGHHRTELPLARVLADAMIAKTELPPYQYRHGNALKLDEQGYIWARNLLANRLFDCPVVYLEPWIANSEAVYEWAAAGDYPGYRWIGGGERRSLPAVYADFVLDGLLRYYER